MRILKFFSYPSSFLEKKKIRKRQGRYKRGISEPNNMDPDHVINGTEITGSNRESIYCLLNPSYSVVLIYLYSCDTGSLYDTNIQYTQLLYWAIR